jgi:hypothetical protein
MSIRSAARVGIIAAMGGAITSLLMPAAAQAADNSPTVTHNEVETIHYSEDICGPRENDTTITRKVVVERFADSPDGSTWYHYTARVDYVSDFVDPDIPDARGSLTEVVSFNVTPGAAIAGTGTFHDYLDPKIRIIERFHVTLVDGEFVVDRAITGVDGCPE